MKFSQGTNFFDYHTVDVPGLTQILNRVQVWDDRTVQVKVDVTVSQERGYQLGARVSPEKVQPVRDLIDEAHVFEFLQTFNPDVCRQILDKLASTDKKLTEAIGEVNRLAEQASAVSRTQSGKRAELRSLLGWLRGKDQRAKVAEEAAVRLEAILAGMDR